MEVAALSLLYGVDVEVYTRQSGLIPFYYQFTYNGPTHSVPIRVLKEHGRYAYSLLFRPEEMES
jgi:hypothetical protein